MRVLAQNEVIRSVSSASTSGDSAAVAAVRRDARAMGVIAVFAEEQDPATVTRLAALKEIAIQAIVSCYKRAVVLNADWIAEQYVCGLL